MRHILKYRLNPGLTAITLPQGSWVRKVDFQNGYPHVWIEQPVEVSLVDDYMFVIRATGEHFTREEPQYYAGSCVSDKLVWHVYYYSVR